MDQIFESRQVSTLQTVGYITIDEQVHIFLEGQADMVWLPVEQFGKGCTIEIVLKSFLDLRIVC